MLNLIYVLEAESRTPSFSVQRYVYTGYIQSLNKFLSLLRVKVLVLDTTRPTTCQSLQHKYKTEYSHTQDLK